MITKKHISHSIYAPKKREEGIYSFESSVPPSQTNKKEKHYLTKVKIRCIDSDATHYYFQLKVIASVYKGVNTPKLLRKINMAFDHVMVKVNKKGVITAVINIETLQENWLKQKEHLKKEYQGTTVLQVFKGIDKTLRTEQKLIKALRHPKMYGLFFNGYWKYDASNANEKNTVNITLEENTTTIKFINTDSITEHKGYFLYKNNSLLEGNSTLDTTKYNILCLG